MQDGHDAETAFEFNGTWREFAPIALTNLLLTIVTLGLYRFWAVTRERRYLWSRTRFIDDRLEWTGTGRELLIGFLLVVLAIFLPLFLLQFVVQALALRGHVAAAGLLTLSLYGLIFYLIGVARFRALRYRLSRSWWHGIRGGSDDQGLGYGWSYVWRSALGYLTAGLMIPWSMSSLWNRRWNAMSFGAHPVTSQARWGKVFLRFILCYAVPFVAMFVLIIAMVPMMMVAGDPRAMGGMFIIIGLVFLAFYLILPMCALAFYAAFLREAVGAVHWAGLDFAFEARTRHWLLLFLGNAGLWLLALIVALVPLAALGMFAGLANLQAGQSPFADSPGTLVVFFVAFAVPFALVGPFIRYRSWRFGVRWLEAGGEIDLDVLSQSTRREPTQGEGLLDAFDIGAI